MAFKTMLKKALALLAMLLAALANPVRAQDAAVQAGVPFLFAQDMRREKPDTQGLRVLRFLTTNDFAPFQIQDGDKTPRGYNVDLARAVCAELDVACTVQVLPWNELLPALKSGRADAVIAGHRPTAALRQEVAFSHPYFRIPARFVRRKDEEAASLSGQKGEARTVAVQKGSAHEAFLKAYFPKIVLRPMDDTTAMGKAVEAKDVDAAFGDGVRLAAWLDGAGQECCSFSGDAYFESHFFGEGMAIALRKEDAALQASLDYTLATLEARGALLDIYLRWFAVGIYPPHTAPKP